MCIMKQRGNVLLLLFITLNSDKNAVMQISKLDGRLKIRVLPYIAKDDDIQFMSAYVNLNSDDVDKFAEVVHRQCF